MGQSLKKQIAVFLFQTNMILLLFDQGTQHLVREPTKTKKMYCNSYVQKIFGKKDNSNRPS